MDLTELLLQPEGKTLELKRDLSSPAGLLRTVVAFANTSGGTVLIGVEDGTRAVRGVTDPLALEERVASLVSGSILPRVLPDIELLAFRNTHVLAVRVYPSAARPHHLARSGPEEVAYVRVGSTNRRAGPEMLAEMRRFARGEAFDEQPMPDLAADAVDFDAAASAFEDVRKLKRADLDTLRLTVRHQGRRVPTVGGVLLFGQERLRHFPDAWVQAGRFAGLDRSRIVDQTEIVSHPSAAVLEAVAFVEKHGLHGASIGAVRRTSVRSLPPVAVREALVNALVHADYAQHGAPIRVALFDDRLEIENPGLLTFGLTLDDLPRGVSKLRNRVLGRTFKELGLVEQWGSGVQRMIGACREAGLPAPEWEEIGTRLRVTLHTGANGAIALDPKDRTILDALGPTDGLRTREVADAVGLSARATRQRLARLVELGEVREIGSGPNDPQRRYFRVDG